MLETNKVITGLVVGIVVLAIGAFFYFGNQNTYQEKNEERAFTGNPQGEILIREYSDFACPACKLAAAEVKKVMAIHGDKVRFEYHHFPLTMVPTHRDSFGAAVAAECANDQNKFWEYHDELFANQESLGESELISYAIKLGMNKDEFVACLGSNAKEKIVRRDMADANTSGVNSTPAFFMGSGPLYSAGKIENWGELKNAIERDISIRGLAATSTQ